MEIGAKDVVPYWLAQIAAGIAAAFVAMFLAGKSGTPMEITNVPAAFVAEFLFTFALAYVVVNCATAKGTLDNSFYGLAIGFTVMAGIFASDRFLAARSIRRSRSVRRYENPELSDIWIHIVAELAGGLLAGLIFKFLNPTDK